MQRDEHLLWQPGVDSRVDCRSDGSCGEPGRAEDGGVIVVDGSVQDAQVPPVDSVVDATVEAGIDGGVDAGTGDGGLTKAPFGSCPVVAACPLGGGATVCGGDPPVGCCNDAVSPGTPRCEKMMGCSTGFVACCGRQGDCPVGTACCASAMSAVSGTKVACGTPGECAAVNPLICRTPGASGPPECPAGKQCGTSFGPPGYYLCQ